MMNSRTLKDGLSAPVTIAGMYLTMVTEQDMLGGDKGRDMLGTFNNQTPLHVVVVGATATNEEVSDGVDDTGVVHGLAASGHSTVSGRLVEHYDSCTPTNGRGSNAGLLKRK